MVVWPAYCKYLRWMIVLRLSCCFSSKYCREIDDIRILCTSMIEYGWGCFEGFFDFQFKWFLYVVAYILLDILKVLFNDSARNLPSTISLPLGEGTWRSTQPRPTWHACWTGLCWTSLNNLEKNKITALHALRVTMGGEVPPRPDSRCRSTGRVE